MEEQSPMGEFHHFQMVGPNGEIPISISVLVHVADRPAFAQDPRGPITAEDCIALHEALKSFDGNFQKAFKKRTK